MPENNVTEEGPVYIFETLGSFSKAKLEYSRKISLLEGGEADEKDVVMVHHIGWFLKNDKRVHKDYFRDDIHIIDDKKYRDYHSISYLYDDVDQHGNPINIVGRTILGYNTISDYKGFIPVSDHKLIFYISDKVINNKTFDYYYYENLKHGLFYLRPYAGLEVPDNVLRKRIRGVKTNLKSVFLDDIKPITYTKMLGKKNRYGLEIETISGMVPNYANKGLYYSSVHDGSLRDVENNEIYGLEYVTDVLAGDQGLLMVKKLCYELTKRCLINKQCSVHVHIGDVIFSKENIVLMYWLYQKIESTLFAMMPISRQNNEYCRPVDKLSIDIKDILPENINRLYNIDKYYHDIIAILSHDGGPTYMINKKSDHPLGNKCGYNHRTARYCWVNMIPSVFDTRRTSRVVPEHPGHKTKGVHTVEFRLLSATTSYNTIKPWLLLCIALVDIVENHKQYLYYDKNININTIVEKCYPNNYFEILNFIKDRIELYSKGDTIEDKMAIEDRTFSIKDLDNNFSYKSL